MGLRQARRIGAALSGRTRYGERNDALILSTQIARTLGLRQRYDEAHRLLDEVEPQLATANAEVCVHYLLERGRTLRSSGKPADARALFMKAFETADAARLEFLAADALHMVALAEPTSEGRLEWNRKTVVHARAARDARSRTWEAAPLNDIGVTQNEQGKHEEALATFRDALAAYQRQGKPRNIRVANWIIANTLRQLGRIDEALAMQRSPNTSPRRQASDPYVLEELTLLFATKGDTEHQRQAETKLRALRQSGAK